MAAGLARAASAIANRHVAACLAPITYCSSPTRELDVGATDTWTAQWQVTPVTNADDLRRLRNLYVLIVSTDEQYDALEAYYTRHPEMRAPIECYGLSAAGSEKAILVPPTDQCPPGYGTGVIPRWKQSLQIIESGNSIGCKMFQEGTVDARRKAPRQNLKGLPFKRWFYWRSPGSHTWLPETPDSEPETLGTMGPGSSDHVARVLQRLRHHRSIGNPGCGERRPGAEAHAEYAIGSIRSDVARGPCPKRERVA